MLGKNLRAPGAEVGVPPLILSLSDEFSPAPVESVLLLIVDRLREVKSLKSTVLDLVGRRTDDDRVRLELGAMYGRVYQGREVEVNDGGREVSSEVIGAGLAERSGKGGTTNIDPATVLEEEFDELGTLCV